jgi:hypothetical protein
MRTRLAIVILLISTSIVAQNTKIKKGFYEFKRGSEVSNLVIAPDNSFYFSSHIGDIEKINDTIVRVKSRNYKSFFKVSFLYNKIEKDGKLKVNYKNDSKNGNTVYFGTQNQNEDPMYQNISEIEGNSEALTNEEIKNVSFEIERAKSLNLVLEGYGSESQISKFSIPIKASEIIISYEEMTPQPFNFKAFYNPKNNSLSIPNGKNDRLIYYLVDEKRTQEKNPEQAIYVEAQENWTYPGKKERINVSVDNSEPEDSISVVATATPDDIVVDVEQEKGKYHFVHARSKTLIEAKENIANKPYKFLAIVFDPKNKNAQADFDAHVAKSERLISNRMYYEYKIEDDKLEYYLASKSDEKLLLKYNIKSENEILFLNSEGDLVYHTTGSLKENATFIKELIETSAAVFISANDELLFDKTFLNKNSTNEQVLHALGEKHFFRSTGKSETDSYPITINVDNLYTLSTSYKMVQDKWLKIVADFKISNKYNEDYLNVIAQEMQNKGFSNTVFNIESQKAKSIDFELLDYIFYHYQTIIKHEKIKKENGNQDGYNENLLLDEYVGVYFNRVATSDDESVENRIDPKVLLYYMKYLELTNFNAFYINQCLDAIEKTPTTLEIKNEYFSFYDKYFKHILKNKKSLIDGLDKSFEESDNSIYWSEFKSNFGNNANSAAWAVVEKSKDQQQILKAIQWSKASLELDPENHYYLDTLAKLYYKIGQREKAIEIQKKAVLYGAKSEDTEGYDGYKKDLEKMKAGTL